MQGIFRVLNLLINFFLFLRRQLRHLNGRTIVEIPAHLFLDDLIAVGIIHHRFQNFPEARGLEVLLLHELFPLLFGPGFFVGFARHDGRKVADEVVRSKAIRPFRGAAEYRILRK